MIPCPLFYCFTQRCRCAHTAASSGNDIAVYKDAAAVEGQASACASERFDNDHASCNSVLTFLFSANPAVLTAAPKLQARAG